MLLAFALEGGCAVVHNPTFQAQCKQIRVGMTRAEAERVMSVSKPLCARWDSAEVEVKWRACEGEASDTAERLQWMWSGVASRRPDLCSVELDENKRVSEATYAQPVPFGG